MFAKYIHVLFVGIWFKSYFFGSMYHKVSASVHQNFRCTDALTWCWRHSSFEIRTGHWFHRICCSSLITSIISTSDNMSLSYGTQQAAKQDSSRKELPSAEPLPVMSSLPKQVTLAEWSGPTCVPHTGRPAGWEEGGWRDGRLSSSSLEVLAEGRISSCWGRRRMAHVPCLVGVNIILRLSTWSHNHSCLLSAPGAWRMETQLQACGLFSPPCQQASSSTSTFALKAPHSHRPFPPLALSSCVTWPCSAPWCRGWRPWPTRSLPSSMANPWSRIATAMWLRGCGPSCPLSGQSDSPTSGTYVLIFKITQQTPNVTFPAIITAQDCWKIESTTPSEWILCQAWLWWMVEIYKLWEPKQKQALHTIVTEGRMVERNLAWRAYTVIKFIQW